ncbi:S1 RNA-binding domain-containing protein [Lentilactobacillus senioris]|uniref:S1 RNA-binding domain-containing protein n=1 Tax=Lentilactobacillus senioris TaxID=931534 RepID=UPI00227E854B|nr:S1 RNA-binding domain-containing protein [Lentilactobacillus senioris]MCY9807435.1 S1 RNA-binding domain-containing protein [Lentilactobacillus senioris]
MNYKIGMRVTGKVIGIQKYGIFVGLDDSQQALAHISECSNSYISDINAAFQAGDKVEGTIIDIDEYTHNISLSLRPINTHLSIGKCKRQLDGVRKRENKRFWTNHKRKIGFKTLAEQREMVKRES